MEGEGEGGTETGLIGFVGTEQWSLAIDQITKVLQEPFAVLVHRAFWGGRFIDHLAGIHTFIDSKTKGEPGDCVYDDARWEFTVGTLPRTACCCFAIAPGFFGGGRRNGAAGTASVSVFKLPAMVRALCDQHRCQLLDFNAYRAPASFLKGLRGGYGGRQTRPLVS